MRAFKAALCAALLTGCAATSVSKPSAGAIGAADKSGDGYILTALQSSSIPKGKCGMILWTLERDRPSPIFRYLAQEEAEFAVNNAPITAALTKAFGASAFGVAENQEFIDEDGALKINVDVRFGLGFDGGAYVQSGLISIETQDGWRFVTPAAGIVGCRL